MADKENMKSDQEGIKSKKDEEEEDDQDVNSDEEEKSGEQESKKRKRKRKRKKKSTSNNDSDDVDTTGGGTAGGSMTENQDKLNSLEHTVYVEGIPFTCTEDEVKEFFLSNGCEDVLQLRLPTWQDSGRLRGYGHVVFDTVTSRNKALRDLNGKHLKNRYLNIQEPKDRESSSSRGSSNNNSKPRQQPEGCRTVFVRNLPYQGINENDVEEVFKTCGKIVQGGVRLTRNYQTKELKGFGYIEFKNPEGAFAAVQRAAKGGIVIKSRTCQVDYDEGKMKGSFRKADGSFWQKEYGNVHDDNQSRKRIKRSS
mmetsp:Transcript_378/g.630  ORF Transcript_378/g.630 Transcript_378/m.630 type:complete len:310 (+) Transcript_378:62-991(+)